MTGSSTERGEHTPGIVERLRVTKEIVVDFDMIEARTETETRLINPDGPEAADLISELVGALEEVRGCLDWIQHQAENAMGTTAGCATTHGDPGGGLEEANRYASDIAINCQMQAEKIDAVAAKARGGAE